jgi:hypothetical protein
MPEFVLPRKVENAFGKLKDWDSSFVLIETPKRKIPAWQWISIRPDRNLQSDY